MIASHLGAIILIIDTVMIRFNPLSSLRTAKIVTMPNIPPIAKPRAQPLVVCDEPDLTLFLLRMKCAKIEVIRHNNIKSTIGSGNNKQQ